MKRDSLFYRLFAQRPTLLFDLLGDAPDDRADYQFDSVEVKETSFRIDGVFLPPDNRGLAYFCEVQFQRDEMLYERLFCEASLYFFRYRERCRAWRTVAIYPSRSIEQSDIAPFSGDIQTGKLIRIYLDELGDLDRLPIGVSLMVLTTLSDDRAKVVARNLLAQVQASPDDSRVIIEILTTIMAYKFIHLTREEVEAMLGIELEQTGFYLSAKAEGIAEGKAEGEQIGEAKIILKQLQRRFGNLSEAMQQQLSDLPAERLESLAEDLLDFTQFADLSAWFAANN